MILEVKFSPYGGKGSFAPIDIKSSDMILTFKGELVTRDEINRRINHGVENLDDPLQVGDEMFIDLHEQSLFINHSCDPNSALKRLVDLYAIKNIKKGKEVTFDYSASVGVDVEWEMNCNCGSNNCRKQIGNVSTIPKNQLMKYYNAGCLQDFIKKQLDLV
ncbi:SET domain-containing protein [Patescibacteria group bacterium]